MVLYSLWCGWTSATSTLHQLCTKQRLQATQLWWSADRWMGHKQILLSTTSTRLSGIYAWCWPNDWSLQCLETIQEVVEKRVFTCPWVFYAQCICVGFTLEHTLHGRNKWDYLTFRLHLAEELIGGFSSLVLQRLTPALGHWPQYSQNMQTCVVCNKRKQKLGTSWHETHITWSHFSAHLCVNRGRDCFKKYHMTVEYWH